MSSASTALAVPPSKVRSKVTNSPSERHGRSAASRRVKDLYAAYCVALGGPTDPPTLALVLSAAEAVQIAETARGDLIAGKGDLALVVRAEGTAARSLRRIGMNKIIAPPRKSFVESLQEQEATRLATEGRPAGDALEGVIQRQPRISAPASLARKLRSVLHDPRTDLLPWLEVA
jgi:hypothetical protein